MTKASKLLFSVAVLASAEFLIGGSVLATIEYLYILRTGKQMISLANLPVPYIESFIAGGAVGAVHGILTALMMGHNKSVSTVKSGFTGWLAAMVLIFAVFFYYNPNVLAEEARGEKIIFLILLLFLIYPLGGLLGMFGGWIRNMVAPAN